MLFLFAYQESANFNMLILRNAGSTMSISTCSETLSETQAHHRFCKMADVSRLPFIYVHQVKRAFAMLDYANFIMLHKKCSLKPSNNLKKQCVLADYELFCTTIYWAFKT